MHLNSDREFLQFYVSEPVGYRFLLTWSGGFLCSQLIQTETGEQQSEGRAHAGHLNLDLPKNRLPQRHSRLTNCNPNVPRCMTDVRGKVLDANSWPVKD